MKDMLREKSNNPNLKGGEQLIFEKSFCENQHVRKINVKRRLGPNLAQLGCQKDPKGSPKANQDGANKGEEK